MRTTTIRAIGLPELPQLQRLGRRTFSEAFASGNTAADMAQYLRVAFSTAQLAAELNQPGSRFFFAEREGRAIGYLKVNLGPAQAGPREEHALEIERIYVLRTCQGQGVGRLLHQHALALAQDARAGCVWLGVWAHNAKAIAFYRKLGYVVHGQHRFTLGSDAQTDLLMRLELRGDQRP